MAAGGLNLGLGLSGAAGGALETAQTGLRERLLIAQQALDDEMRRAADERDRQQREFEMSRVARDEAVRRAASQQGRYSSGLPTVAGVVSTQGLAAPPADEGDLEGPRAGAPPGMVSGISAIPRATAPSAPGRPGVSASAPGVQMPTPLTVAGVVPVQGPSAAPRRSMAIPALAVGDRTLAEGYDEPIRSREEVEADFVRQAALKEFATPYNLPEGATRRGFGGTLATGGQAMPSGAEGHYLRLKTMEKGGPLTSAETAQAIKEYKSDTEDPEVRALRQVSIARAQKALNGSEVKLTPGAIEMAGTQYRLLGTAGIPTRLGEDDRKRIMNESDKQIQALGQTPAAMLQQQFALKADAGALNLVQKLSSLTMAAESKALAQATKVLELSDKVSRSDWTLINRGIIAGKTELFSDPTTSQLQNAMLTFTNEYAKIMEGSVASVAGSSESARRDAGTLISSRMSQMTVREVIALMRWEMRQTLLGYDVASKAIRNRMIGLPPGGEEPGGAPIEVDEYGVPIRG